MTTFACPRLLTEANLNLKTESNADVFYIDTETGCTALLDDITPPVPINRPYDPFQQRLMPQSQFWSPVRKWPSWRKH